MSGQINLVLSVSLLSLRCRQRGRRDPWYKAVANLNGVKIVSFMHVLTSTLISAWDCTVCNLEFALATASLNKKKGFYSCTCVYILFASICFVYLGRYCLHSRCKRKHTRAGIKMHVFLYIVDLRLCLRRNYAKKTKSGIITPRSEMSSR